MSHFKHMFSPHISDDGLRLTVETLESRRMLAGNVSARINADGDLIVRGDSADNDMSITVDALGRVEIVSPNGTTNFDRVNLATALLSGDVRIDTLGGNDRVWLESTGASVPVDRITIKTAGGADQVRVNQFAAGSSIEINQGSGNDLLFMNEVTSSGMTIQAGGGSDSADLKTIFANHISANLGSGIDEFLLEESSGVVDVTSGGGNDFVGLYDLTNANVTVRTGGGLDSVELDYVNGSSVDISTAAGIDVVSIEDSDISGDIEINTGSGDDSVELKYSTAGSVHVSTGGGSDYLSAGQSELDQLGVILGGGNDHASLVLLDSSADVNGGGGTDRLTIVSDDNLDLQLTSIEELT